MADRKVHTAGDSADPAGENARVQFAVYTVLDQTIGYITGDGSVTTRPAEAQLFQTREGAEEVTKGEEDSGVEEVPDEAVFRARRPTWEDRPLTAQALFDMAVRIEDACFNPLTKGALSEQRVELVLMGYAASNLLSRIGHRATDGRWAFGQAPGSAEVEP
jgi:hypothetical protein